MNAAAAEALADPRIGPGVRGGARRPRRARWDEPAEDGRGRARRACAAAATIEWATRTVTQGEVLDAFAAYCRDELDDVEVLEQTPTPARRSAGGASGARSSSAPASSSASASRRTARRCCSAPIGPKTVERFLDDETLRAAGRLLDLARLEKIAAVRSSVFVYLEWFLRDAYGVKILARVGVHGGLVERGIISLGMG